MKKTIYQLTLIVAILFSNTLFAQESTGPKAKKPQIFVMPADNWMEKNGFVSSIDNMGTKEKVYEYER